MSEISLILVLQNKNKQNSEWHGKSTNKIRETHSFWGIFSIMEQFDAFLAQTIDSSLGLRCTMFGYQYSEILRSLMCVYLCGGSCIEDVTTHLMKHLSLHPTLRTCSADTILRATSRIKTFVFKFISVPAKWIKTSRRHVLNIYSDNYAYDNLFKTDFG